MVYRTCSQPSPLFVHSQIDVAFPKLPLKEATVHASFIIETLNLDMCLVFNACTYHVIEMFFEILLLFKLGFNSTERVTCC